VPLVFSGPSRENRLLDVDAALHQQFKIVSAPVTLFIPLILLIFEVINIPNVGPGTSTKYHVIAYLRYGKFIICALCLLGLERAKQ
jgi:hypothetical protein